MCLLGTSLTEISATFHLQGPTITTTLGAVVDSAYLTLFIHLDDVTNGHPFTFLTCPPVCNPLYTSSGPPYRFPTHLRRFSRLTWLLLTPIPSYHSFLPSHPFLHLRASLRPLTFRKDDGFGLPWTSWATPLQSPTTLFLSFRRHKL